MEKKKREHELQDALRQQRKLNYLLTQTELFGHFMAKKLTRESLFPCSFFFFFSIAVNVNFVFVKCLVNPILFFSFFFIPMSFPNHFCWVTSDSFVGHSLLNGNSNDINDGYSHKDAEIAAKSHIIRHVQQVRRSSFCPPPPFFSLYLSFI